MSFFRNQRLLIVVIVVLFILNGVSLSMLWGEKKGRPHKKGPRHEHRHRPPGKPGDELVRRLSEKLELTDEQSKQIKDEVENHFKQLDQTHERFNEIRKEMFFNTHAEMEVIDSLLVLNSATHKQLDSLHVTHFRQLRSFLTEDQYSQFDEIMNDIAKHFIRHRPREGKHRRGRKKQ